MKVSLFSQSLFALPLEEAIPATREAGYSALELACQTPHLDIARARDGASALAAEIKNAGLVVSALSLFGAFTDRSALQKELQQAETFIRLAPVFSTRIVKMTPGPPSSATAGEEHWRCLEEALRCLRIMARDNQVRLAFETHMRQMTDTLAAAERLVEAASCDEIGITLDFSNIAFAGDDPVAAIHALAGRIYNTHVKNGYVDEAGNWHFQKLDQGLTHYDEVLSALRDIGYDGYLTVECLGPRSQATPVRTAREDLEVLTGWLQGENDGD